jgi:penicillin amidase
MGLALGRRRPVVRGEVKVPGVTTDVVIRRTAHGIPCIEAETDEDAHYGIGFVHAQDRGFQLETLLRIARGTLSELVGEKATPLDRMSRRIGFARAGMAQWPACDPDIRALLTAYAAGVNAGFKHGITRKPHEFTILGGEPTQWEPEDVLTFGAFQSFLLPGNWDVELARLKILRADGPEAVSALDPLGCTPVADAPGSSLALDLLLRDLAVFQQFAPVGGGSNNWAIHGSRTKSGKPLLASDPHLSPSLPAPWYLLNVRTPEWAIAGATFAGSPAIPVGHNGHVAWGVTAGLTDNTDLFRETLGPDGASVRESDGTFHPCPVVEETIAVKGGADVVERVVISPRGPVVSPIFPGVSGAISLRAVWLDPHPLRGFLGVHRATTVEEFRKPFEHWPILPLNVVCADSRGTIGYQLIGRLPVRNVGNGTIPLPGDAPGVGWDGLVPFRDMPTGTNPPAGFYATANATPPEPSPAHLGHDFCDPYRADTITDELAGRTDWDVESCQHLHLNQRSMPWEQMRGIVLACPVTSSQAAEARTLLNEWDGVVAPDSAGAAVFELFVAELSTRVAKAKAPNSWRTVLGGGETDELLVGSTFAVTRVRHLIGLLRTKPEGWFPEGWDRTIEESLAAAVTRLREIAGPGPGFWGWGHLRPLTLRHPLLGKHRLLGRFFNLGPIPCGGDANTINQAAAGPLEITEPTTFLPNMRTVFDTADWSKSRFVLAGGQSGNPCSPHFDDLFPFWQKGEGVPIPFTRDEAIRAAVNTVRVRPLTATAT